MTDSKPVLLPLTAYGARVRLKPGSLEQRNLAALKKTLATLNLYSYQLYKGGGLGEVRLYHGSHDIVASEPVEVGHDRQLLMDWHVVDDHNGVHRTVHQPRKHPNNPVLRPVREYEGSDFYSFGTVIRDADTGMFRLWTNSIDVPQIKRAGRSRSCMRGHYFESDDGLDWRRPELGLVEYAGSTRNNIILQTWTDSLWVLPLPERMQDRGRYALLYCDIPNIAPEGKKPEQDQGMTLRLAFGDDGIHFTDAAENPILAGQSDTGNNIVYNPERDVFMVYRRPTVNAGQIRRIAYSESRDLVRWTQPTTVIHREENDALFLYSMHVTRYHGVYLGQLLRLHMHPHFETQKLGDGKDFKMDTELAWSRDGIHWGRHPDKPEFIPTGNSSACDWGMAMGMGNIIEMDDHLRIYYGGWPALHPPGSPAADEEPFGAGICLATLRRDGFVSIDAGIDGGYMLTRPLTYPGGRLHINARTKGDGFIKVAVRDGEGVRDGEWPEDFRFEEAVPFVGDSLSHQVTWRRTETLDSLPGAVVRLHFWMENAELYSFWFES